MLTRKQELSIKIISIIAELRNVSESTVLPESKLFENIGFDSLSFLELIVSIEAQLDDEFDFLAYETEDISVDQLIDRILEKVAV